MTEVKARELSQETRLIAAKEIIKDYAQACSNVDEGNLYFAATQYQAAFDKALEAIKFLKRDKCFIGITESCNCFGCRTLQELGLGVGEVKRYDLERCDVYDTKCYAEMSEDTQGCFIKASDYDSLKAERDQLKQGIDRLNDEALSRIGIQALLEKERDELKEVFQNLCVASEQIAKERREALDDLTRHKEMLNQSESVIRLRDTVITQLQRAQKASDELKGKDIQELKSKLEKAVEENLRMRKHLWNLACEDWYWAKWPEEKDGKIVPGVIKDIQAIMAETMEALKEIAGGGDGENT